MDNEVIHLKFHHKGEFFKGRYADGAMPIVLDIEPDLFSYAVLMEHVKEDLKYTEIGGVYVKNLKAGGWKLLANDKDSLEFIEGFKYGDTFDFYIDIIVDKDIEPMKQMQPHVVVRPRPNLFKGKKIQQKCTFVTIQDYQKQHQPPKRAVEKSPVMKDADKGTVRRKLTLENDVNDGKNEIQLPQNDEEDEEARLIKRQKYERVRETQMQRNKERLKELKIPAIVEDLRHSGQQKQNKRKGNVNEEGGDENIPDVESEADTENVTTITAKRTNKVEETKVVSRPRTRSRVINGAITTKEKVTESIHVPSSAKDDDLPPSTNEKKLQQKRVVGDGSMAAFLQLRERQKLEELPSAKAMDEAGLDMAKKTNLEPETMEVMATKKRRGETRMDKVYARNEKKLITLNQLFQPVSDHDDRLISELSNFLGTLAKDYVPLTFVNWHHVPDKDKDVYWDIVLDKYILPEEGRPWVMRTICDAWRLKKSRVKGKHYYKYDNDAERIKNRPVKIPLEEFKVLLQYWGDEEVQADAERNSKNRKTMKDVHTAGPITFAQIAHKMKLQKKLENPDQEEDYYPTKAELFFKTRKREKGREYKSATKLIKTDEKDSTPAFPDDDDKSHGPSWLIGRHAKTAKLRNSSSDTYLQLTAKIRKEVADEMEEKLNQKVQESLARVLKKLGEANPNFNVNMQDLCNTSTEDGNGTPITPGASTDQGTNRGASS